MFKDKEDSVSTKEESTEFVDLIDILGLKNSEQEVDELVGAAKDTGSDGTVGDENNSEVADESDSDRYWLKYFRRRPVAVIGEPKTQLTRSTRIKKVPVRFDPHQQ